MPKRWINVKKNPTPATKPNPMHIDNGINLSMWDPERNTVKYIT